MNSTCPVELDSRRYFTAVDADAASDTAIESIAASLRDDAESGHSIEWMEYTGDVFSQECNAILSDAEDDKLGRINDARCKHINAWARQEAERRYYQ